MGYADYVKNTAGSQGGQMLVRVADAAGQGGVINGNDVQFFVRSGLSQTYVGSPGFGTSVYYNNTWVNLSNVANYSNSTDWRHVGTINVGYSQTIQFHINASGTSGFGGADDYAVYVSRGTVPPAPTMVTVDQIAHQDFRPVFNGNGDGGLGIIEWQVGFGLSSSTPTTFASSSGSTLIQSSYRPGASMYVWARGRNSAGWGPWSNRLSFKTLPGVRIRVDGVWKDGIPYVKVAGVWKPAVVYIRKAGVWTLTD